MKIFLLKRLSFHLLIAGLVAVLAACDFLFPAITIKGTVTITRNGELWSHDSYSVRESMARSSPPGPPYQNCPHFDAYIDFTNPNKRNLIGSGYAGYPQEKGKYPWSIEISPSELPNTIYFHVMVPIEGLYASIMLESIWVEDNDAVIDLGVINFDAVRLWGNLPVTFNGLKGEATTAKINNDLYKRPEISITKEDGSLLSRLYIDSDGNWVQDVLSEDSGIPLTFTLYARENGGVFSKVLNPDTIITVPDTDTAIIFPDYPSVDFEAVTLSGTIKINNSTNRLYTYSIDFYDDDVDSLIGVVKNYNSQKNLNGLSIEWETMVPAFSFPMTLRVRVQNRTNYSITLTEDTDLSAIDLGSFSYDLD